MIYWWIVRYFVFFLNMDILNGIEIIIGRIDGEMNYLGVDDWRNWWKVFVIVVLIENFYF